MALVNFFKYNHYLNFLADFCFLFVYRPNTIVKIAPNGTDQFSICDTPTLGKPANTPQIAATHLVHLAIFIYPPLILNNEEKPI